MPAFFALLCQRRIRLGLALSVALMLTLVTGCQLVKSTAELSGKAVSSVAPGAGTQKGEVTDPVEVQQNLLRFADEYLTTVVFGVDKLRRGAEPLDPAEVLRWKIAFGGEVTSIASGPNPMANLLDLTVFVTVTRRSLENYWRPEMFGPSVDQLLEGCRNNETNLWRFVARVLSPDQQAELRAATEAWERQNPSPEAVLSGRAVGFTSKIAQAGKTGSDKSGNLFNFMMLDPLAGLDPATREIAETRLFAERALYVTQKMPWILRWQTELFSINTSRLPAVQQLVTNSSQVANAAGSFGRIADQLPGLLNEQRDAAIKQIFESIASERTNLMASLASDDLKLRPMLADLRGTLAAGAEMARATELALKSLDAFTARFDKATNPPAATPKVNARPFDILDYATTARELSSTLNQLNATLNSLDKAFPQIEKAAESFETLGNRLVTRFFLAGAGLIAFAALCSLALLLLRRRLQTPAGGR